MDAVPFLPDTSGTSEGEAGRLPDPHSYLRDIRAFLDRRTNGGILLGEVDLPNAGHLPVAGPG